MLKNETKYVWIWLDNIEEPLFFNNNTMKKGITIKSEELDKLVLWLKRDDAVFELKLNDTQTMILYKSKISYAHTSIE